VSVAKRKLVRMPKDKLIQVRASEAEVETWFEATRVVCGQRNVPVSLSKCVREAMNEWARRVLAPKGAK
jgi:hypothetical protein